VIEVEGDLWDLYEAPTHRYDIFCITVNGTVKKNGAGVMGAGIAKQAAERWPDVPTRWGTVIKQRGPCVHFVRHRLVAFPVKPASGTCAPNSSNVVPWMRKRFGPGQTVPGWAMIADAEIIQKSLAQLQLSHDNFGWTNVYLPRPGCGAGTLRWADVRPLCEPYGDWLKVIHLDKKGD